MAADRTPNELADALEDDADLVERRARGLGARVPTSVATQREAAVLLRRQGEQLDTLRAAIGDPDELRRIAVSVARDRKVTSAEAERRIGILTALAAAVPQDPERCACGKPATGTVDGIPTCGDDR